MPQGGLARTPSGTGLVEGGSKCALSSHFQLQPGFLEVEAASMVYVLMIKSLGPWQCGRLGPPCASKCAPEASQLGLSRARLAPFHGFRSFSTAEFCSLQLPSSTVVLGMLWGARGELLMDL